MFVKHKSVDGSDHINDADLIILIGVVINFHFLISFLHTHFFLICSVKLFLLNIDDFLIV